MAEDQTHPVIEITDLSFAWRSQQPVLDIERFAVQAGERLFLHGPSGSGKSTLLGVLAGVLMANRGTITVLGQDLRRLSAARRDQFRSEHIGIIFQMFNLLPYLSLVDNVTLPCRFSKHRRARLGTDSAALDQEAKRLLERLRLPEEALSRRDVTELSVGQQQRVAAARALIGSPELVIADEPTSSLDADARGSFIDLLSEECAKAKTTLLFVSHDLSLAERFGRTVDLMEINRVPLDRKVA